MTATAFGSKLALVLKVLSLSRGRLAADLKVDKSVVGRWAGGSVTPSGHNLAQLTQYVAARIDGFTMLDWDRPLAGFAALIGADLTTEPGPGDGDDVLRMPFFAQARRVTAERGADLECFFRTTRPAERSAGVFLHDHGIMRMHDCGLLEFKLGVGGVFASGWMLPVRTQFFCIASEPVQGALNFAILNGGTSRRPQRMDGISLAPTAASMPGLSATPLVIDRLEELTGDRAADDARYLELLTRNPIAAEGSVPPEVAEQLSRSFGPGQLALGGEWLMHMPFHLSLAAGD